MPHGQSGGSFAQPMDYSAPIAELDYRARFTRFYHRYNQEKLRDVDDLMTRYSYDLPGVIQAMVAKYGKEPGPVVPGVATLSAPQQQQAAVRPQQQQQVSFATGAIAEQDYRARIQRYYMRYNPEKVGEIDALMKKYEKDLPGVMTALKAKYGPEPGPVVAASAFMPSTPVAASAAGVPSIAGTPSHPHGFVKVVHRPANSIDAASLVTTPVLTSAQPAAAPSTASSAPSPRAAAASSSGPAISSGVPVVRAPAAAQSGTAQRRGFDAARLRIPSSSDDDDNDEGTAPRDGGQLGNDTPGGDDSESTVVVRPEESQRPRPAAATTTTTTASPTAGASPKSIGPTVVPSSGGGVEATTRIQQQESSVSAVSPTRTASQQNQSAPSSPGSRRKSATVVEPPSTTAASSAHSSPRVGAARPTTKSAAPREELPQQQRVSDADGASSSRGASQEGRAAGARSDSVAPPPRATHASDPPPARAAAQRSSPPRRDEEESTVVVRPAKKSSPAARRGPLGLPPPPPPWVDSTKVPPLPPRRWQPELNDEQEHHAAAESTVPRRATPSDAVGERGRPTAPVTLLADSAINSAAATRRSDSAAARRIEYDAALHPMRSHSATSSGGAPAAAGISRTASSSGRSEKDASGSREDRQRWVSPALHREQQLQAERDAREQRAMAFQRYAALVRAGLEESDLAVAAREEAVRGGATDPASYVSPHRSRRTGATANNSRAEFASPASTVHFHTDDDDDDEANAAASRAQEQHASVVRFASERRVTQARLRAIDVKNTFTFRPNIANPPELQDVLGVARGRERCSVRLGGRVDRHSYIPRSDARDDGFFSAPIRSSSAAIDEMSPGYNEMMKPFEAFSTFKVEKRPSPWALAPASAAHNARAPSPKDAIASRRASSVGMPLNDPFLPADMLLVARDAPMTKEDADKQRAMCTRLSMSKRRQETVRSNAKEAAVIANTRPRTGGTTGRRQ